MNPDRPAPTRPERSIQVGAITATYNPQRVVLNGQTHPISSNQRGMASALVRNEWKKIADEDGQLIGCIDHNRIILPLEITAEDNDAARATLAFVLEKAVDMVDFDVSSILREKEDKFARHFLSAFQKSVQNRLSEHREELDRRRHEADQAYYTIVEFERERSVREEEISLLSNLAEKPKPYLATAQAKALLQIQSNGLYSLIVMDERGVLRATTSPVIVEHEGYEFPLGRYEVEIPPSGDVRIKALDEHPNADRDERPFPLPDGTDEEQERYVGRFIEAVADEKADNIALQRPAIRKLGPKVLREIVRDILRGIMYGGYSAKEIAKRYGLTKPSLSRFAGIQWDTESRAPMPDLWRNISRLLAKDTGVAETLREWFKARLSARAAQSSHGLGGGA